MSSRLRTALILAAVAIAGFGVLATMAERYRRMTPERSVLDLPSEPAPTAATPPPAAPRPEPAVIETPKPPEPAPATPPRTPGERTASADAEVAAMEKFLEVRGAIREFLEGNPKAARRVAEIVEKGETTSAGVPANPRFLAGFRGARMDALARVGLAAEEYVRVRASFTAWRKGEGSDGFAAAFAAKGETAARADLGPFEALDYDLSF